MHSPWQSPLPELQANAQPLKLFRGQARQVWLAAGSLILCQAPAIYVTESPQWQVERLTSRQTRLADGERMVLEQDGWVEIHAPQGGELLCLLPHKQAWHAPLAAWVKRMAAQWQAARQAPRH